MIILKNMKKDSEKKNVKDTKILLKKKKKKKRTWERYHNITEEEKKAITTKAKACWVQKKLLFNT